MRTVSRILVVRPDRIGDVVMMTPLLRELRKHFPQSYIAALVHPRASGVLVHNPRINELLVDDPEGLHSGRSGFWRQVRRIRKRRFDTALLLLPTERLAWMLFAAGIPRRYGVGVKLYGVLTGMRSVRRVYEPLRHEADYCLDFGRRLGIETADTSPEMFLTNEEKEHARKLLLTRGINGDALLVGIHPGSGGSAPNWRTQRYAELCELLLRDPDVHIILTGGPSEVGFWSAFSHLNPERVVNLIGVLTLRELAAIIGMQRVFVSASTGPMHIAAALRVATVSLFCPMPNPSATHWGPLGNSATIVEPPPSYCGRGCSGVPHTCDFEGGIQPSDVAAAVLRSVRSNPDPISR